MKEMHSTVIINTKKTSPDHERYYTKESLLSDPDFGPIVASLLVK